MNDYIRQYSIDIENNTIENIEDVIADTLEAAGITVVGIAWKATWNTEDYWQCKPPISSD